ncbi:MBL fold metallo-hydrolase [bacterium]|nr:MBL fold metallo-hydrolase [bacterium]
MPNSDFKFEVIIRGCRGSYPKPGKDTIIYGGNTTCTEVKIGNCLIIFDAGTGIITLGQELCRKKKKNNQPIYVNIFFTHIHHDHTEGLPFFEPAYFSSTSLNIFGPSVFQDPLVDVLSQAMLPPFFPVEFSEMKSRKLVQELSDGDTVVCSPETGMPKNIIFSKEQTKKISGNDIQIRCLKGYAHPKVGIYIYSVLWQGKKLIFATDTEGYAGGDQRLIKFAEHADLLIHDAQFTSELYTDIRSPKQGWGHSTVEMAVEVAEKSGVEKLVLTHHDPNDTDEQVLAKEKYAKTLFNNVECAVEDKKYSL